MINPLKSNKKELQFFLPQKCMTNFRSEFYRNNPLTIIILFRTKRKYYKKGPGEMDIILETVDAELSLADRCKKGRKLRVCSLLLIIFLLNCKLITPLKFVRVTIWNWPLVEQTLMFRWRSQLVHQQKRKVQLKTGKLVSWRPFLDDFSLLLLSKVLGFLSH